MTKRELSQLYHLNREIDQQKKRIAELESAAVSGVSKITGMPHVSGISDKVGDIASEIADLKSLVELNLRKCLIEQRRLMTYINGLEDSELRQILSLRYVNGLMWFQVAMHMGAESDDAVRKKHDRWLEKQKR